MGGSNIANAYDDSQLNANAGSCAGLKKGACAKVRIQNGSMPQGRGCTGNPVTDANRPACLTQAEQDTLSAWIDAQMPE